MTIYSYVSTGPGVQDIIEGIIFYNNTKVNYTTDQAVLNKYVSSRLDRYVDGVLSNTDLVVPYTPSNQAKAMHLADIGLTSGQIATLPTINIAGSLTLGSVLTATINNGYATGFQWYNASPIPAAIVGATDIRNNGTQSLYTLVASDVVPGVKISTRVSGMVFEAIAGISAAILPTTALPVITGVPTVGTLFTFTQGIVTGSPTPVVVMTLTVAGINTALPYTPGVGDGGKTLVLTQTATNSAGSVSASSSATISVGIIAPSVNTPPVIIGSSGTVGVVVNYTTGIYNGSASTVVRQYTLDNVNTGPSAAAGTPYTPAAIGQLRVIETATNTAGSVVSTSAPITIAAALVTTNPRYGYAPANSSGNISVFATLFASMVNMTGSSTGGRIGSFNTVTSTTNYTWLAVLASAASTTLRVFDGTGYGGFSGAPSIGIGSFNGIDQDPITSSFLTYTDGSGNIWNMYRSNGKASTFNGLSIL